MGSQQNLPDGWRAGEDISVFGDNVSVPAGGTKVIATLYAPIAGKVAIEQLSLRNVDVGMVDKCYFTLRRNKMSLEGFRNIPGTQTANVPTVDVGKVVNGGEVDIVCENTGGLDTTVQGSIIAREVFFSGRRGTLA